MDKPLRYAIAIIICIVCFGICIALMTVTGVGGFLAMLLMCFIIKYIWNAIVHYGEDSDTEILRGEEPITDSIPDETKEEESADVDFFVNLYLS